MGSRQVFGPRISGEFNRVAAELNAGTVWINTYRNLSYASPSMVADWTGYGRELGLEGLREFTSTKSVWVETGEESMGDRFVLVDSTAGSDGESDGKVVHPVDDQTSRGESGIMTEDTSRRRTPAPESPPLQPVKTAYEQVAEQLKALIMNGHFSPGDKLPVESELVILFGVSRSTVREALRVLSSQDLIQTSRGVGGGSFVVHPNIDAVSNYLEGKIGLMTGVKQISVDDLLEARALLEVPASGLAAKRRTPEQLEALAAGISESGRSRPEVQMQFHQLLLEAADNRLLTLMTAPLFSVLRTQFLRDAAPDRFWTDVREDHRHILEAIESSAPELAKERMASHLSRLRETYLAIQRPGVELLD